MKGLLRLAHASESGETGAGRKDLEARRRAGLSKGDTAAELVGRQTTARATIFPL